MGLEVPSTDYFQIMSPRFHCFWLQFRAIYLQGEILSDDVSHAALTDSVKAAEPEGPELRF